MSDGGCVWVVAVVCGSWWLCVGRGGCGGSWRLCVSRGGCVWVMAVVCESWWLCVSRGGCVCGSWWLCVSRGGCVCELREVSKDAIICQRLQTSKANLGTVHYNSYCIPYIIDFPHITVPTILITLLYLRLITSKLLFILIS